MPRQPLDIIKYSKQRLADSGGGVPTVPTNGSCPTSQSHKIGDTVRRSVSDLSSLLGMIVTMRTGMDDLAPRTYLEIAQILESSLPQSVRDELSKSHGGHLVINEALVEELEVEALRKLAGR